ncbi:deoxyribose-phosphate aldolase [Candidatus Shapirobacteria bacterium CG10_big_fil_rev_8_21_14_0_10_40_9]|uniref:Deoxyribose-phosphate aldolase n=1 Tax=Candidatus Shapirobacteria bacterium CG10_big_fil_rev_8_21_14_0_10_40_9 TaxID=1974888 RepID=A0A2M8L4L5_9BACT|nr:MAG: deoxyribose-phosphate aldolase [Candidatus Shapirobacteria bacterium CG10_big_fil_rev_8_21_14_0_10_40_9]
MDPKKLAQYLDLANHHQEATPEEIHELCQKVKEYGFHSAFVNPCYISLAREFLGEKGIVGTVISFPLGQDTKNTKIIASIDAVKKGVDELDISANVGLFKAGKYDEVLEEMQSIVEAVKNIKKGVLIKFIIETGQLSDEEIKKASQLVLESGADFVKTTSGLGPRGASLKDVELIKEAIGDKIKIKVAGGIDTLKEAEDFIGAGADRMGTSKGVEIIEEAKKKWKA